MSDELHLVRRMRRDVAVAASALERARAALASAIAASGPSLGSPPSGFPRIVPHLIYDDVEGALAWLARAFGFRERAAGRATSADGRIEHAEMELGGGVVMLGPPSVHGDSPRRGVSAMVHVYVDDVDRHCERARAAGATIVLEPEDQPWGDRRYQARDPEGHQWHFAERIRRTR
jgi:uncharacterized glyoxalase superfamily protein PhnB